jgi:Flp pilus assembly pilin Flp
MQQIKNQNGQGLVEYLIIVALVAVGTIGIMRVVGQSLTVKFTQVARSLGAEVEGKVENAKVTESLYRKKDLRSFVNGSINQKENATQDE